MTPSNLRAALLASIAGLALCATSVALARPHYNDNGPIGFTPDSGGYCDYAGCPDHFWRYPVHYGPVFYAGRWYKGPVYFRGDWRDKQYWVRGGWHRDEWRGPRPDWARNAHDGQALPFAYYADHGFRLGERWRRMHDDERYWDHGGDWHGGPPPGGPGGPPPPPDWRGGPPPGGPGGPPPDWNRDHGNQGDWNRNGGGDRDDRDGPPDNGRGGQGRGDDRAAPGVVGQRLHVAARDRGRWCVVAADQEGDDGRVVA